MQVSVTGGKMYIPCCVRLPYELRQRAKKANINLSALITRAVEEELVRMENKTGDTRDR